MNLTRIVISIVAVYLCYATVLFLGQRAIIYPGRTIRVAGQTPAFSSGIGSLWLETRFGRSEAWFLPAMGAPAGKRPVVLCFHGNGEVIDFLPKQVEGFQKMGMDVVLVEYPGYGRSEGCTSEASITATAIAAYDTIIKRDDVDPGRMIAFGRSLGCAAACTLAANRPVAALVLQAPFTSTRPFARRLLLPAFLVRDIFDNRTKLAAFPGPVLILHGNRDDVIPLAHGRELAGTASKGRLIELSCAHNDCPPDWPEFWHIIEQFFEEEGISGR